MTDKPTTPAPEYMGSLTLHVYKDGNDGVLVNHDTAFSPPLETALNALTQNELEGLKDMRRTLCGMVGEYFLAIENDAAAPNSLAGGSQIN